MFPSTSSQETLRFSGNKIHCSPRDQSVFKVFKADFQSVLRTLKSLFMFFCFASCKTSQNVNISHIRTSSKFQSLKTTTIDPMHKWLPIKNSFVSIKISPTYLVLELIIQKNFYFQTRLVGLI